MNMNYQLKNAVWELTMACNMRCKHCGSSCTTKQDDELTTEEALNLCDQLAELGMKEITLSGGELTLRNDWHMIAKRLTDHGIVTSMITNGWLLDDEMIAKAKDADIRTIAISIDGLQKTHDAIRRTGSFERDLKALRKIRTAKINPGVVTTLHEANFPELEGMYNFFLDAGVTIWQFQIALPMGNFTHHKDLYLKKERMKQIIDFCYSKIEGDIRMCPSDCIGYFTQKEIDLAEKILGVRAVWNGCPAGKNGIGILCNGDIVGCTSIRDKQFVAGNIRNTPLRQIWESEDSFRWNREFKKSDLKGFCHDCIYGDKCLGGCTNSRYCFGGDIYSENEYCAWNWDMKEFVDGIDACDDEQELAEFAYDCICQKHYQPAFLAVKKLIAMNQKELRYQDWFAFLHYQIGDYATCIKINEKILKADSSFHPALKGLGLATFMNGDREKGLQLLRDSLPNGTADAYVDLYYSLIMDEKTEEAAQVKQEAAERFSVDISDENWVATLKPSRVRTTSER